jgi:hypothetical protein
MAKYVEDFNEWALSMYREYMRISNSNTSRWKVFGYAERDSIQIVLIDLKKGKCGKARVSKGKYIEAIGIGVAWARLRNYEIPKERKKTMLKNLTDYDKFSVITLENVVFIKIGDIPETKDVAVYDSKKRILLRLSESTMVYKIN